VRPRLLDVDVLAAQQDVQAKVARIRRTLPREIDEPVINHFDPNDRPIISVAMQSTDRPMRELTSLADEVVSPRLQAIPGVGGINTSGGETREIRIELDPAAMRSYGIGPPQVISALSRENQEVPAGRVQQGPTEQLFRVTGRIVNPSAFANIAVAVRNGVAIRLGDVAKVVEGLVRDALFVEVAREPVAGEDAVGGLGGAPGLHSARRAGPVPYTALTLPTTSPG